MTNSVDVTELCICRGTIISDDVLDNNDIFNLLVMAHGVEEKFIGLDFTTVIARSQVEPSCCWAGLMPVCP